MSKKLGLTLVTVILLLFTACSDNLPTAVSEPDMSESNGLIQAAAKAAPDKSNQGFDEFGYNYAARIFVGPADGVDRKLDGKVWGDPTYANDRLKMSWSKAWDDAKFNGAAWGPDAFEDNQWNGKVPGGSGETWHYRIIWVGPELENSQYWREGGYAIWGQFEVIMSHGTVADEHFWEAHAVPTGMRGSD
jgi:hypothetical protein